MIWVYRKHRALYETFKEWVYSDKCPNKMLKYQFENKNHMAGVSPERMIRLLEDAGYAVQIVVFHPDTFKK